MLLNGIPPKTISLSQFRYQIAQSVLGGADFFLESSHQLVFFAFLEK
jgi:hypothetical protein